jgi:hypothetical protein
MLRARARWWTPGRAVVAAVLAAVAATGCAAGAHSTAGAPAGPAGGSATPSAAATGTAVAVPQAASTGDPSGVLVPAPAKPPVRCRPLVHYAAGNAGPLFCTNGTDNPAALRYFSSLHLAIMQLGPHASQAQAISAICADLTHASGTAEYSAYLLSAKRENWYFVKIADAHGALSRLCPKA